MRSLSWTRSVAILLLAVVPTLAQSAASTAVSDSIRETGRPVSVTAPSATAQRYAVVEAPRAVAKKSGSRSKVLLILGAGAAAAIVGILSVKSGGASASSAPPSVTTPPPITIGNISIGGPR